MIEALTRVQTPDPIPLDPRHLVRVAEARLAEASRWFAAISNTAGSAAKVLACSLI